jgi:MFS family permease
MSQKTVTNGIPPLAPRQRFLPILTQQAKVPWAWVAMIQIPWFIGGVVENLSGTMMTFTLRKFVSVPMVITLLTSFNLLFNMLVGATCNYLSDRVWTRYGRRRPFLIAASLVTFVFLLIIPIVGHFWVLVGLLFLYEMIRDIGSPTEPLEKEVVPPPQRGRGQAITQVVRVLGGLFFSAALIGRFDEKYALLGGWNFTGEMLVYWVGAVMALGLALFYWLAVKELPPPTAPLTPPQRGFDVVVGGNDQAQTWPEPVLVQPMPESRLNWRALVAFLVNVFGNRQSWAIYLVGVIMMVFWTGLGNLGPLLITEQWGYSKQTMGNIGAVSQAFTLLAVLPLGGWIVDRLDRNRLFVWCCAGMTLHHVAYYLYARYMAPDGVPPVSVLMAFGIVSAAIGQIGTIASVAMQFDYMATSQMGTVSAGIGITRTIVGLLTANVIGVWVTYYSKWFNNDVNDYLSGYHYLILLGAVSTAAAWWFVREARKGRLVKYGILEQQQRLAGAGVASS